MNSPTILDVAQEVGVSASTVSRALSGGKVKASTRRMVLEAAQRLGYKTADGDQGHSINRRGSIGLLTTDIQNFYTVDLFKSIIPEAQSAGYKVVVADINVALGRDQLIHDVRESTDGMVVAAARIEDDDIRRLFDPETTVLVSRQVEGFSSVVVDDFSGMFQSVRHLASLGHNRVAYLGGDDHSRSDKRRRQSFEDATGRFNMESLILGPFEPSFEGGVNAADALMMEEDVTAVIVYNDLMASGVLNRLIERGVDVPGEVSLIGVDNSMLAQVSRPKMTSVAMRQNDAQMALRMLLSMLEQRGSDGYVFSPQTIGAPESLIVRDTTGPVPGRADQ
ncbi:hypothetical protein EP30_03920 [Bifidobacterium sp. UTCIF-39]|uniref:LacI family DNA-binding transcriptional regulator n=1 Tax=Bifidobacterium sp. UTCIF-39 TaxID=1465359 RepID=UPI0015E36FA8|nr:LacI family DNA-binding transcriptional regulator [Bifidobacterium sp. UTCIF-39]TPF97101.1 hypothetical protein EP30_03920 [Bifidobacterium sp. UTCIF-39]